MEVVPIEVYSQDSNFGILKMPARNYPGCVIQGDSLRILVSNAKYINDNLSKVTNNEELILAAKNLYDLLSE